ncbi:hypothetical protein EYC80_000952 [Monilinia laxa]|uniref:Uncharacterized protein n=1 Tax=Monilinia laxa TaxID=61186 RepID=A0A5N6K7N8_MONLA|nr:hypothetical protein EYC80_000952 [Monilinia laxa]
MEPMRDWIEVMKPLLLKPRIISSTSPPRRYPWSISPIVPARACDSVLETSNPHHVSRNSFPRSITSPECLKGATWTYVRPLFEHDPHSHARTPILWVLILRYPRWYHSSSHGRFIYICSRTCHAAKYLNKEVMVGIEVLE